MEKFNELSEDVFDEEIVLWLRDRERKLEKLEDMIQTIQNQINDEEKITDISDIKMEIFKLWYFKDYNKEYES